MAHRFVSSVGFASLLALVLASLGDRARAQAERYPGAVFRNVATTGNLVVKFAESARVRARAGALVSDAGVSLAGFEDALGDVRFARITPLFEQPEALLARQRREAEQRSGDALPDLASYTRFTFDGPVDLPAIIDRLNDLDLVRSAYPEPVAEEPTVPSPYPGMPAPMMTPDFTGRQDYRAAPPDGINAIYGNRFPGGLGNGVQVIDYERGWNHTHEDLGSPVHISGAIRSGSRNHGTAVMGELIGVPNGFGVTGIAPSAVGKTLSYYTRSLATALNEAATNSSAGDMILLEVQIGGPGGVVPVEWDQSVFDVIQIQTARGIIFFEAAGNGSNDLDDPVYLGRFNRANRDSGAIMCAASDGERLDPASFTNYGSRIDCHGWGWRVVTAGYGALYGNVENEYYTATFSGTSSASPICTGAGLILQGVSKAMNNVTMSPAQMRALLAQTGNPQNPNARRIGPRPDVKRALSRLGVHLSTDGVAYPGRVVPIDLVDIDSPNGAYWLTAAFGDSPGITLPDNRVVPVNADALFYASLLVGPPVFTGFQGQLDANGEASAAMMIADVNALVGMTLHLAFIGIVNDRITTISNGWPIDIDPKP